MVPNVDSHGEEQRSGAMGQFRFPGVLGPLVVKGEKGASCIVRRCDKGIFIQPDCILK